MTNTCNLRCRYCPYTINEQRGQGKMHASHHLKEEDARKAPEASGATPGGCARAHPPERNIIEKGRSTCKIVRQSLKASTNTPFEPRGLLSGTIIRVPPTLLNSAGNHHQRKLQRLMGAIQVKAPSTQGTRSRLARAQPRAGTVDPGEFTPRPLQGIPGCG